jgi:hypothetical protein
MMGLGSGFDGSVRFSTLRSKNEFRHLCEPQVDQQGKKQSKHIPLTNFTHYRVSVDVMIDLDFSLECTFHRALHCSISIGA